MPARAGARRRRRRPCRPRPGRAVSLVAQASPAPPRSWMPDHELAVEQLQAGLDEPLLLEGVAHLDAGPLGVVGRRRRRRRSRPRPARSRRRCRRARWSTRAGRPGCPGPRPMPSTRRSTGKRAQAQHVDQRVLGVAGVEGQLAADGRHADRVAVAGDPADHALDQPALAGVVERPEEQRVHDGQRPGPHGEDVPQDAARPRSPRPGRARWPRGGCGSRCGWPRRCRRRRRSPRRSPPGRPGPWGPRWAGGAGGPGTTCRSSARSTSRRTGPAPGGWASGRGSWPTASNSSSVRPSARCSGRLSAGAGVSTPRPGGHDPLKITVRRV